MTFEALVTEELLQRARERKTVSSKRREKSRREEKKSGSYGLAGAIGSARTSTSSIVSDQLPAVEDE